MIIEEYDRQYYYQTQNKLKEKEQQWPTNRTAQKNLVRLPPIRIFIHVPPLKMDFHIKGMDNADWGMKDRMSRIFNRKSGNTLMLAFDHGYIMGASTGLERLDILIPQLAEDIDVFMATRGALRTCVPPTFNKGVALRCPAGSTVLSDDVTAEFVGVDIEMRSQ